MTTSTKASTTAATAAAVRSEAFSDSFAERVGADLRAYLAEKEETADADFFANRDASDLRLIRVLVDAYERQMAMRAQAGILADDDVTEDEVAALSTETSRALALINGRDPLIAPKQSIAYNDLVSYLQVRDWVPWAHAIAVMRRNSDIALRTATERLKEAVAAKLLEEDGKWSAKGRGRTGHDSRVVRLKSWPEPEPHAWVKVGKQFRTRKKWPADDLKAEGVPGPRIQAAIEAGFLAWDSDSKTVSLPEKS